MTGRLQRTSCPQIVAGYIRKGILSGLFQPGERLRLGDITSDLGVSRFPVREAILALDREGWLHIAPVGGGAYVTGLRRADVVDHYELRGMTLGLVAARAAAAVADEPLKALQRQLDDMCHAVDAAEFSRLNDEFLRQIGMLAAAPGLRDALRVSPSIIPTGFFELVCDARTIQESGAAALMRSFAAGDPSGADAAMRRLLRRQGSAVLTVLEPRGLRSDQHPPPSREPDHRKDGEPLDQRHGSTLPRAIERVADHVRQKIIAGEILPGQRLFADEIALAARVSRTPVREALIALEREGWVRIQPYRGAFAMGLSEQDIVDHHALYGRYLGFAARRLIESRNPDHLRSLDALAAKVAVKSSEATLDLEVMRYTDALVSFAQSARLNVALHGLRSAAIRKPIAAPPGVAEARRAGLCELHCAIRRGDPERAEQMCITMQDERAASLVASTR
jgi:DNA-binding GntR family transcriptional regulator